MPYRFPGHGDQGLLNAIVMRLGKVSDLELLPEETWCNSSGWNASETVDILNSDGLRLNVINRRLQTRQRLLHSSGPKWWTDAGKYHIVRERVEENRVRHPSLRFEPLDLICGPLPDADIVLVRDCLVHFSFHDILPALKTILRTKARWLITTHFPKHSNVDIALGQWRPLNLTSAPFHFPAPDVIVQEGCEENGGVFADKSLGIWRTTEIAAAVEALRHL